MVSPSSMPNYEFWLVLAWAELIEFIKKKVLTIAGVSRA